MTELGSLFLSGQSGFGMFRGVGAGSFGSLQRCSMRTMRLDHLDEGWLFCYLFSFLLAFFPICLGGQRTVGCALGQQDTGAVRLVGRSPRWYVLCSDSTVP